MGYYVTFRCDSCEVEHITKGTMDMPPYWIGMQLAISDNTGAIPPHEQDHYQHFCSIECASDYMKSKSFKKRKTMVDKKRKQGNGD